MVFVRKKISSLKEETKTWQTLNEL